jgi:hypothetical protein
MSRQEAANSMAKAIKTKNVLALLETMAESVTVLGKDPTMGIIKQIFYRPRSLGIREHEYGFFLTFTRCLIEEL